MKCIHCLNEIPKGKGKKEKDHLFPKSWYPDTTSEKVQRWTIPSCGGCNRAYGEIEKEMLISIGMAIEPSHYASMGISQKAINSLDPSRAENERDRSAREATFRKIQGRLIHGVPSIPNSVIPNIARREDQKIQYQHGLFIPEEHITMICRKFVKGITWIANKLLIDEENYNITSSPMQPDAQVMQMFNMGTDYSRPPGLIMKRFCAQEDPGCGVFFIAIWQQYLFYATCMRKNIEINNPLPPGLPQQPA